MRSRRLLAGFALLLLVGALLAPLPTAEAQGLLGDARRAFVRDRNTCALAEALTKDGVRADARAPTDMLLAFLACNRVVSPASTAGTGYDALPAVVVALRDMDLDKAMAASERVGDIDAGGVGWWAQALVFARRGRDDEAIRMLLTPIPGDSDLDVEGVLFPLSLFGAALPTDDRLLLAAVGREALYEACRSGRLDRVTVLARRVAALDSEIGPDCICLAARALRRSGRIAEAGDLLIGPESTADSRAAACVRLERAIGYWRAGRPADARRLLADIDPSGPDVPAAAAFLVEALKRASSPLAPVPSPVSVVHAAESRRDVATLARFATLLGSDVSTRSIEAAALGHGLDPTDAGFASRYLESLGYRVVVTAGGAQAGASALAAGLPFLLYRIDLRGTAFLDAPVVVRARDTSTGLWIADPCDLREVDALPADAPVKARVLVAVPASRGIDPATWSSARSQLLGRLLERALDAADRGDLDGALSILEAQASSYGRDAVFQLYAAFLYYRRYLSQDEASVLQLARRAVDVSLRTRPTRAFEYYALGEAIARSGVTVSEAEAAEALDAFERAQDAEPYSAFLARKRYQLYRSSGRPQRAMDALDLSRRLDPRDPAALFHRSYYRAAGGDTVGARQDLRRAFDRRPEWKEVVLDLVDLELENGHPVAALAVIDEYVQRVPDAAQSDEIRDRRARAERRLVQAAKTVEALEHLLDSPLEDTRRRIVFALLRFESDAAAQVLRRLLHDAHHAVRVTAIRVFMRPWLRTHVENDQALGQRIVSLLRDDPSEAVRGAAAGLLSLVEQGYAAKVLATTLVGERKDRVPYVRAEAAGALVPHDGDFARSVLIQALEDDDAHVRRAAIDALFRIAYTYHGFDPDGDEKSRREAVERWREWHADR